MSRRIVGLIANSMSDTLTVVDGRALEPVATIKVGREPHKFRQARVGRTVYSCNTSSNEMLEIDPASLRIVRRIPILDPYNVVFTRDGRYLYKVAYRHDFVEIHDGQTFQPLKRLHTGRQPSHMWFSPDQRWFVDSNQHANSVSVIDTEGMVVARQISVDPLPAGVEISRDGRYLFVASHVGTISVFATDEWKLVRKVDSGKGAHEMAVTADGRTIYVTNRYEDTTSVFDVAGQLVVEKFRVPGGPDMPVLSPGEDHLWISGRFGDTATVVDTRSLKILNTFPTGHSPHGIFIAGTA
jgi:YVTN family beta-propeller protein